MRTWLLRLLGLGALTFVASGMALAGPGGQPLPWQIGLPDYVTPVGDHIHWFHNFVMIVITAITIFVLALLVIVIVKFNARANPVPSKTTHNTAIEVAWTLIPVIILVAIAVPSFKLLFTQLHTPQADLTIKAIGKQWFWSYNYPDAKFEFDSLMVRDAPTPDRPRLLAADNAMVVPVNKVVRVQTTATDVIHAWAVPAFGVIIDAVPGRLNETWFKATKEGVYYGQCRELCGRDHAFMPIEVRVVSEQAYATWVDEAKKKWAYDAPAAPATTVAAVKPSSPAQ